MVKVAVVMALLVLHAVGSDALAADQPPAGAITANAAFPPIGATWMTRVAESPTGTIREMKLTATAVSFNGQSAYGIAGPTNTFILNPVTFNLMATMEGSTITSVNSPDLGQFSWPLWVGKTWTSTFRLDDFKKNFHIGPIVRYSKVAAYEDVTVPAGTFKAFRVEQTPGVNEAVNVTYWYAPGPRLAVKYIYQRLSNHYLGIGGTTTELLTMPK